MTTPLKPAATTPAKPAANAKPMTSSVVPAPAVHLPTTPPPPATYAELYAHFGDPRQAGFENAHIVTLPETIAGGKSVHIRCHRLIAPKLAAIFAALRAGGHIALVKTYDGAFVVRNIRGNSNPSLHSWGLAIDLNADEFPLGSPIRQAPALIQAFHSEGFFYGGDFHHRKDGMHWEYTTGAI